MTSPSSQRPSAPARVSKAVFRPVRWLVFALAGVSGVAVLVMMTVTCLDVALRIVGRSLVGAVDIVTMASAVAIACALPYTTAVKGHVAVEYFFHKLGRTGRVVVDTVTRLVGIGMFAVVCRECIRHGNKLRASHTVSMTLQIPTFWVSYVIAVSAGVVVLVILYNLLHPGREMIKP